VQVINFYLALLLRRQLAKDGGEPRVHFHSTFFYNKLYRDAHEYNYKNVSRCVEKHGRTVARADFRGRADGRLRRSWATRS
jgi:Ulp1 family protease